jgi:hypothetical protein
MKDVSTKYKGLWSKMQSRLGGKTAVPPVYDNVEDLDDILGISYDNIERTPSRLMDDSEKRIQKQGLQNTRKNFLLGHPVNYQAFAPDPKLARPFLDNAENYTCDIMELGIFIPIGPKENQDFLHEGMHLESAEIYPEAALFRNYPRAFAESDDAWLQQKLILSEFDEALAWKSTISNADLVGMSEKKMKEAFTYSMSQGSLDDNRITTAIMKAIEDEKGRFPDPTDMAAKYNVKVLPISIRYLEPGYVPRQMELEMLTNELVKNMKFARDKMNFHVTRLMPDGTKKRIR